MLRRYFVLEFCSLSIHFREYVNAAQGMLCWNKQKQYHNMFFLVSSLEFAFIFCLVFYHSILYLGHFKIGSWCLYIHYLGIIMGICSPVWFNFSIFSLFPFLIVLFCRELIIFHSPPLIFPPRLPDYFSFPWLVPLARNSSTVLKRSGESTYPCFGLDLREKTFSPSLLSITLAVSFS